MSSFDELAEVCLLPLAEVAGLLKRRELSALELMEATLRRIELLDPLLNTYLAVSPTALEQAKRVTDSMARGQYRGPLHGIPISLKDNIATVDMPTCAGSPTMSDWRPREAAVVVQRLEARGAILIGKSHMFELAYGAPHAQFGEIRNPWDLRRTPGGSSSGSAASVAAGLCHGSVGTDTGGSIRIPAAFCGIVGLKPTYGAVSRRGVVPVSWNLDHVGPLARTVVDAAVLLRELADDPGLDGSGGVFGTALPEYLEQGVQGVRVGVLEPSSLNRTDPEVVAGLNHVASTLSAEGADVTELRLPALESASAVMWIITAAEAAEYHRNRIRTRGHELHPLVLRLLRRADSLSATDYVRAQRTRQHLIETTRAAFSNVDVLLLPTTAMPPFELGHEHIVLNGQTMHIQPAMNQFTPLFNLTGQPALSLPCGFTSTGLPIGCQLTARPQQDMLLLRVARAFERATNWHTRRPDVNCRPRE